MKKGKKTAARAESAGRCITTPAEKRALRPAAGD